MYRRSYYRGRTAKYSNETMCVNAQTTVEKDGGDLIQAPITVVPATTVLGNRKVKNFTLKFNSMYSIDTIIGILAYVPEGTTFSTPTVTGSVQSLYEPNQNVIATFVIPPNCTRDSQGNVTSIASSIPITVSNRLARNLNTGDSIQIAFVTPNGVQAGDGAGSNPLPVIISGTVNYSIKY